MLDFEKDYDFRVARGGAGEDRDDLEAGLGDRSAAGAPIRFPDVALPPLHGDVERR